MTDINKYVLAEGGTGHTPHKLVNPDDTNDALWLCSCGGTRDPKGWCDGTHASKQKLGCPCWFCRTKENRIGTDPDLNTRCG